MGLEVAWIDKGPHEIGRNTTEQYGDTEPANANRGSVVE